MGIEKLQNERYLATTDWIDGKHLWVVFLGQKRICTSKTHGGLRKNLLRWMRCRGVATLYLSWDNDDSEECVTV